MPSTSGRVRMPHNNRVSTSGALKTNDIWSKTIGHNPYAADHEREDAESAAANAERARGLLELARHQNVASNPSSGNNNDDFVRKMFLGLKGGKKRRSVEEEIGLNGKIGVGIGADGGDILSSSSEEEFVEEDVEENDEAKEGKAEKVRKSHKKKRKKKSDYKEKKRKSRKRHEKRRRNRYSSGSESENESSDSSDNSSYSSDNRRHKRRKPKSRRRESRKKSRKHESRRRDKSLSDSEQPSDSDANSKKKKSII